MAGAAKAGPRWASPGRLLLLFCVMCLFIYLDRGAATGRQHLGKEAASKEARKQPPFACSVLDLPAGMIASNGVNGGTATEEHAASGILGDFGLSLFQVWRIASLVACPPKAHAPPAAAT